MSCSKEDASMKSELSEKRMKNAKLSDPMNLAEEQLFLENSTMKKRKTENFAKFTPLKAKALNPDNEANFGMNFSLESVGEPMNFSGRLEETHDPRIETLTGDLRVIRENISSSSI